MKQTNVRVPDLEREVETKLHLIVQKAGLAAAQATSIRSKEGMVFLFQGCHQAAQSLIDSVNSQLQISANTFALNRGLLRKDEERNRLLKTILNGEEKIINLSAYARKSGGTFKRRLLSLLIILLSVGDSAFNQRGFERLFRLNYIGSLVVSVVVAAMLAFLAHDAVPKYVLSPNGNRTQRTRTVIGVAIGAFFILGIIRFPNFPTLADVPQLIAFTIISAASFMVACLIGIKLYESRPTQASTQEEEAAKELEALKKEVEAAKEGLQILDKNTEEQAAYTASLMEYGLSLKSRIVNETTAIFFDYLRSAYNNREPETNPEIYHFTRYPYDFETEVKVGKRSGGNTLAMLLTFFLMSVLFSCKPAAPEQGELAVTVLIDNTTPLRNLPDTGSLKRFAGLDKNIWQSEIRFEIGKLSDVDYEASRVHTLLGAVRWLSNYEERQLQVDSFTHALGRSLEGVSPDPNADLRRSIIYRPLARHANALHALPYTRKYILVWSDLMHHESSLSFYGKSGRKKLRNPEKLEALFLQQVVLDDLSDITIIFIHQSDEAGNADFLAASAFFSNFFARHGAKTRIAASLPTP
ncbi:hypothetical protein [Flavobacterium sp.]